MKIEMPDVDKFLQFMVDHKTKERDFSQVLDNDLRKYMGIAHDGYMQEIMAFLEVEKPLWFTLSKEFNYGWIARLNKSKEQEIRDFLTRGGFAAIETAEKKKAAKKELREKKESWVKRQWWLVPALAAVLSLGVNIVFWKIKIGSEEAAISDSLKSIRAQILILDSTVKHIPTHQSDSLKPSTAKPNP